MLNLQGEGKNYPKVKNKILKLKTLAACTND